MFRTARINIILPDPDPSWYDDMDPASLNETKARELYNVLKLSFSLIISENVIEFTFILFLSFQDI